MVLTFHLSYVYTIDIGNEEDMMSYYRIQDSYYGTDDLLSGDYESTSMNYMDIRHGVSCCDSLEQLAAYIATSGVEIGDDPIIIELDGYPSEEEPLEPGRESLIEPTAILSISSPAEPGGFYDLVDRYLNGEDILAD